MRRNIHIPNSQVNYVRERIQIAETTGSVLDDFDNAVETFSDGVGQTGIDESDDTLIMVRTIKLTEESMASQPSDL